MLDGLKRKLAAMAISTTLKSLATSKDTRTTITGIVAAIVLAVPGLDFQKLLAGDVDQIAHLTAALLVAALGYLSTKPDADGKTTLLGAVAGALYAMAGSVEAIVTGTVIAALGHLTNKPAAELAPGKAK